MSCLTEVFSPVTWALLTLLVVYYIVRRLYYFSTLPPGPYGLPVVGYLPFMDRNLQRNFKALSEKYGDVFSIQFGQRLAIVLTSWDAIKEAFIKNSEAFAGRPQPFSVFGNLLNYKGLFSSEDNEFKEQKKFIMESLRDFGLGQLSIEGKILKEAKSVTEGFIEDTPIDLVFTFKCMTINVISAMIFGKRFDDKNEKLRTLCGYMDELMRTLESLSYLEAFPILSLLPAGLSGLNKSNEIKKKLEDFIEVMIKNHITDFDVDKPRDIIDLYLKKMQENGVDFSTEDNGTLFCRIQLRENIKSLFATGSETTSATMLWVMKFMVKFPEIQAKIQEEIDRVVGTNRPPSWNDRPNLPYTEATLHEVNRMASYVPIPPARCNPREITFRGYRIPMRSFIFSNLWQVHYDPKLWKDPEEFDPTRFLDENGKAFKPEYLIPFNVGIRSCIGESLAKMEAFLFVTYFLQNFSFRPASRTDAEIDIKVGFERKLKPFNVIMQKRSQAAN